MQRWLYFTCLIISLQNHRNCPCSFLRHFLYQQPSTMTDSPVGLDLTPEGTEPPPPPDPDESHSATMFKRYNHAKLTLPAEFYLKPCLSSSLLLTKTQVPNPTSILRRPSATMATRQPCATMPVTFTQEVKFNRKSKPHCTRHKNPSKRQAATSPRISPSPPTPFAPEENFQRMSQPCRTTPSNCTSQMNQSKLNRTTILSSTQAFFAVQSLQLHQFQEQFCQLDHVLQSLLLFNHFKPCLPIFALHFKQYLRS
jgi:hypothetical protein